LEQRADAGLLAVKYDAMLDQNVDEKDSDTNCLRLKQARTIHHPLPPDFRHPALNLDLFAADCGRAALTLDEIKEWASVTGRPIALEAGAAGFSR
jgi:hypothetical protein